MLIYDSYTKKKRKFTPLKGNTARIYTCGPSVYNYSHIGNFRTYVFEDVLVRYIRYSGYGIKRVMNITDIEDKAINAANKEGLTLKQAQKNKIDEFFREWDLLGLERPEVVAKASGHIPQIEKFIQKICRNRYCITDKYGIYFDIRKFREYGALGHNKKMEYFGKASGDDYSKIGKWDFWLWRFWSPSDGKIGWKSGFGYGRPGWHIECSAISTYYLGKRFDIHCGGSDNVYPHHENEIAQNFAAYGIMPANFWMHSRHLTINKKKMSKRLGNVFYVSQLMKMGIRPRQLRLFLLSKRYRSKQDFSTGAARDHAKKLNCMLAIIARLAAISNGQHMPKKPFLGKKLIRGFETAMDNDLDTGLALRRIMRILEKADRLVLEKKMKAEEAAGILDGIRKIDTVLGIFF